VAVADLAEPHSNIKATSLEPNNHNNPEPVQPVSLRNFIAVLFKRKSIILTFFLTVVIVVTAGSFLLPKIFQSSAQLLVEKELDSEKALLFRMNFPQGYEKYDFINSEIEIIKSYPIALRVVNNFAAELLVNEDKDTSRQDAKQILENAIKNFQKKLDVENLKNSNIITITYENKDPRVAAGVVNYLINAYVAYRSEISTESDTYKFFEDQINIADERVRDLEQRQADFKERKEVGSPEAQRAILMTRLTDYEKSLTDVHTKRIGKEAKLQVIREQRQLGSNISIPSNETSDSPSREKYIAILKGDLLDLEMKKEQLLQKFTPQYEEVVHVEQQIVATRSKIENEIQQIIAGEEASIRALQAEEQVLQNSIEGIKRDIRNLAQNEYQLQQISRGIDDNREIYSMLLKQGEEARISQAKLERGVKIKVVSPAVASSDPVKPKKLLNIVLSVFLGLFGGLGLAFFIEYFDHTINTPEELERYTGIAPLGSVKGIALRKTDDPVLDKAWQLFEG
jgi:succinoglycan biosynthesis transport protein ExoP